MMAAGALETGTPMDVRSDSDNGQSFDLGHNNFAVPGSIRHHLLIDLFNYWDQARDGAPWLLRTVIDPSAIKRQLPHIHILDIEREAHQLRYSLVGEESARMHGRSIVGTLVDDLQPTSFATLVLGQYWDIIEKCLPAVTINCLLAEDGRYWHYERLSLPLSRAGAGIDGLLCGTLYWQQDH